eukprot:COSAG01_NODE_7876_length_3012_cov_22.085479_2_plen_70_part_00
MQVHMPSKESISANVIIVGPNANVTKAKECVCYPLACVGLRGLSDGGMVGRCAVHRYVLKLMVKVRISV